MRLRDRLRRWWYGVPKDFQLGSLTPFDHSKWSKEMFDAMAKNITLAGVDMAEVMKPEPVCPITKALIVQQLSDLGVKHPDVSVRELISIAMQDGVKDDYELARKLEGVSEILGKRGKNKMGESITIRTKRYQDDATDALRMMVDNMALANVRGAGAIKLGRSGGCSDPAGKNGSSSAK